MSFVSNASKFDHEQFFGQVKDCLQKQGKVRLEEDQIAKIEKIIDEKLKNPSCGIMLYGIYNAGKSTLINALLGKEVAAVSDRPETATIHHYEWLGYRIFDTPGVDAPAEHQEITEEHLSSVEVVIFVMSTNGAFDEVSIYDRLAEVIRNQKHLIIVLNDKTGVDEQNKHAILSQVNNNLIKALNGDSKALEKVPVVFLNARTALKGRLESKKILLKKSNITQLEAVIQEKMAQTSAFDSIRALAQICLPTVGELSNAIGGEFERSSEATLLEQIRQAELLRINFEMEVERAIARAMPAMQDLVRDKLYEGTDDPAALKAEVVRIADQCSQNVLRDFQKAALSFTAAVGPLLLLSEANVFGLADHVTVSGNNRPETRFNLAGFLGGLLPALGGKGSGSLSSLENGSLSVLATLANSGDEKNKNSILDGFQVKNQQGGQRQLSSQMDLAEEALQIFDKDRQGKYGGFWEFLTGSNEESVHGHLLSANQQAGEIRHQVEAGLHEQLAVYAAQIADELEKPLMEQKHALNEVSQHLLTELEVVQGIQNQLKVLVDTV